MNHDTQYIEFRALQEDYFQAMLEGERFVYTTDAPNLFDLFLANLPANLRQHYNCRCCKQFFERFGSLVVIEENGIQLPIMWPNHEVPPVFSLAMETIYAAVRRAKVTGVFLSTDTVWGTVRNTPQSGPYKGKTWSHIHAVPPIKIRAPYSALSTCDQRMAVKVEEFGMIERTLKDFNKDVVERALDVIRYVNIPQSEKVKGPLTWLAELHRALALTRNEAIRHNLIWRACASAPVGFAHIRSGLTGTLLEDVRAGLSVDTIKAKYEKKVAPTVYMRPTAAPSGGLIDEAEKAIAKMGLETALQRRYARLDEVEAVWVPRARQERAEVKNPGLFEALRKREVHPLFAGGQNDAVRYTWEKFQKEILPEADLIEILVPTHGSFFGMLSATDPAAYPILWWDRPEARNPVNYYVLVRGDYAVNWGLKGGSYVKVNAIALDPSTWKGMGTRDNTPKHVFMVLEGAKPSKAAESLCLFPEDLTSSLHGYRKVIEAFNNTKQPTGAGQASACGYVTPTGRNGEWPNCNLRVTNKAGTCYYVRLDRWS